MTDSTRPEWVGKCVAHMTPGVRCTDVARRNRDTWDPIPDWLPLCNYHGESLCMDFATEASIKALGDPRKYLDNLADKWEAKDHPTPVPPKRGAHEPLVYFFQRSDDSIKIGTTVNIQSRQSSLETGSGPLVLLGTIAGGYTTEQALHRKFAEHRIHGEWFNPAPEILELANKAQEAARAAYDAEHGGQSVNLKKRGSRTSSKGVK